MKKDNKNIQPVVLPDFGKATPQAIDAEESLLGTCMIYPDSVYETRLKPEMFYKDSNRIIYAAIIETSKTGRCDLITVTDHLRKKNELEQIGGILSLTKLTNNIYTDQMISNHALIIKEKYLLREYIRIGYELTNKGFTDDLADLSEFAESSLFQLSDFTQVKEPKPIDRCIDELIVEIEKIQKKEKSLVGVPSGFTAIDRITGGWQPGNLIIIAGRPSMGKTALALSLVTNAAKLNYPVCFFSLEMSETEITTRLMSGVTDYTNIEIRNARVDMEKFASKSNDIAYQPIYIDDTSALSLFELRSKVKKVILRHGVKLVVVDYLQLMKGEGNSREQEVSAISRGLKAISKEFNLPVIALSQLNRSVEDRGDKKPRLSDLRESGAIEQDADIVCFVYRPSYYGISTIDIDNDTYSSEGLMLIDCAKDRNGGLFCKPLYHNQSMTVIQENKDLITNNQQQCSF